MTLRLLERLLKRTEQDGDCWSWTGAKCSEGYGRIQVEMGRRQGRIGITHRVAYELLVGAIPAGAHLDHLCRNRACVNPEHLEPVDCRTNVLRGSGLSAVNASKTHCKRGHEFTEDNTRRDRNGSRYCRACASEYRSRLRSTA